jgi:hypothetical protein
MLFIFTEKVFFLYNPCWPSIINDLSASVFQTRILGVCLHFQLFFFFFFFNLKRKVDVPCEAVSVNPKGDPNENQ